MDDDYVLNDEPIYEDPVLNLQVYEGVVEKENKPVIIKVYNRTTVEDADRFLKAAVRTVYCYPRIGPQLHGLAFTQNTYGSNYQINWVLDLQGQPLDEETKTRDDGNMKLPQALEEFEQGELLHDNMRNNNITIFRGRSKHGHRVLIKHYWRSRYTDLCRPVREMLQLARVAHPNVCRLFDFSIKHVKGKDYHIDFALVFEDNSDTLLVNPNERLTQGNRIPEAELITVLKDTSAALQHAKTKGVAHRDLKPDNIFRGPNGEFKVSDFNATNDRNIRCIALESLEYIPYICPELRANLRIKKRDERKTLSPYVCDVFSLGMVILHAACLEYPGSKIITDLEELKEALREELQHLPYSIYFKALLGDMVRVVTEERPTIEQVHVKSLFFLTPSPPPLFQSQASFPYEMDSFADFIIPANLQILADEAKSQVKEFDKIDNFDGPELFMAVSRVAVVLRHQGRLEEALDKVDASLVTLKGKKFMHYAIGMSNKALVLLQLGRLEEAEECARESLQVRQSLLPEEHYSHANGYAVLSAVLKAKGAVSEAAEDLGKAIGIARRKLAWVPARIVQRQQELLSLI